MREELNGLTSQLDEALEDGRRSADSRDAYHSKMKDARARIAELRQKRQELSQQIDEAFAASQALRRSMREKIQEAENVKSILKSTKVGYYTAEKLERKIAKAEWRIQTGLIGPKEERRLFEEISRVERMLEETKVKRGTLRRLRGLSDQIDEIKNALKKNSDKIESLMRKRPALTREIRDLAREYRKLRKLGDESHEKFVRARVLQRGIEDKRILVISRLKALGYKARTARQTAVKKREHALKQRIVATAAEKMKRGEKLSFEEFRILMEQDQAEEEAGHQS
ncbi:MAG: hypothetical protein ACETV0_08470 [Nitrososphaeria archaeon]